MAALSRRIEGVRDTRTRVLPREGSGRDGGEAAKGECWEALDHANRAPRQRNRGGRLRVVRGHCSESARSNSTHTSIGISRPAIAAGGGG